MALNSTTSPSADSNTQNSFELSICWVGLFTFNEGKTFKLLSLKTSNALLAAQQLDLELGQHRCVQPGVGVQQPGCGHHPQVQL
jgi:hypothetical protein